jgi:hypothetical protein
MMMVHSIASSSSSSAVFDDDGSQRSILFFKFSRGGVRGGLFLLLRSPKKPGSCNKLKHNPTADNMQNPSFFRFFFIPCIAVKPEKTHHPTIHPFLYLPSLTGHLVLPKKNTRLLLKSSLLGSVSVSLPNKLNKNRLQSCERERASWVVVVVTRRKKMSSP